MFDDLQPLIDGLAPTSFMALCIGALAFALKAVVTLVATFARGERSENAYRVLKVLTRRKPDPPGSRPS